MATAWDYVRHAISDVDRVNTDLMDEVLRIVGGRVDRQLTSAEIATIMQEVDQILNLTYGLSPEAAQRSTMLRTILSNTDAATEGPIRSFFQQLERDARRRDPSGRLWTQIETSMRNGGWGPKDRTAELYRALTGPHSDKMRVLRSGYLDPNRRWVPREKWTTKRGYRLSDRVWRNGRGYRGWITRELREGMQRGDGPLTIAKNLERYLNPELLGERYTADGKVLRRKGGARGGNAAHGARRLARTEVKHMHHEATVESVRMLPREIGGGIEWALSNTHPLYDICDIYASQNLHDLGPGVYPVDEVPTIPHPYCECTLLPWFPEGLDLVDAIATMYGF